VSQEYSESRRVQFSRNIQRHHARTDRVTHKCTST
jgi:hypothetical protein